MVCHNNLVYQELTQTSTFVDSNADNASFVVTRENNLFKIIEQITVYKGVGFAEISFAFQGNCSSVNFDWLQMPFEARGFPVQTDNSIGIVDNVLHEVNQASVPFRRAWQRCGHAAKLQLI